VRSWPGGRLLWRVGVTVAGVATIALGVVLLPLPGPGWLVIFAGLGLLATEYAWAAALLRRARSYLGAWTAWLAARPRWLRIVLSVLGVLALVLIALAAWWLL
jgi:uncharacterized protein (TIGR02611 family)